MKRDESAEAVVSLKRGTGHHGRAARIHSGKRYLLVTASNYSIPVTVIGSIANGTGRYILLKTTR